MLKISVILCLLMAFAPVGLTATVQEPDILYYNGKIYPILGYPLDGYFHKFPDKKPATEMTISSNWRGYLATWKIENQRLYLIDVTIHVSEETHYWKTHKKTVLAEIFPGQKEVTAQWFDGLLVINMKKKGRYKLIRVQAGEVIKQRYYNRDEYMDFRERQFQAFKKTSGYQELLVSLNEFGPIDDPEGTARYYFNFDPTLASEILLEME